MRTIYRYTRVVGLLSVTFFLPLLAWAVDSTPDIPSQTPAAQATSTPPSGTVEMSLDHDESGGTWSLHITGSYAGEGAVLRNMWLYGADASGTVMSTLQLDTRPNESLPVGSPFTQTLQIPKPDPDWSEISVGLTISTAEQSVDVRSSLFPIIWHQPVIIDHAISGTILDASNYVSGGVPEGIGIPHTLINTIPEGDYYAVVFFADSIGCPSTNYEINSFRGNAYWGYDISGPGAPYYAKAYSSAGGGCMQKFHIDPAKGDDWLWGALSNTGTSSAVADLNGIPAFAICATVAACDPIIPHAATTVPEDAATTTRAVSNVLFLPGIKGSKLYEDNPLCLIPSDSCGIPLWLPLADAAAPELFLNDDGKSKKHVFVREGALLGSALGQSFYDSFTHMLDDVKADGSFGIGWDWKAVAYDWRLSLPGIISGGVAQGDHVYYEESASAPYIQKQLEQLASSSPTKKVTIIAHSNGGLVAKALMEFLGDTRAAELIDKVVLVGVPQSGAPRALGALMYGDEEGIPGIPNIPDLIMSKVHAREFALNSPMAYHLLPSAAYFAAKQPTHPLVQFEDGDLLAKEHAAYGPTIDTEKELDSFARAEDGDRTQPAMNNLSGASVLNAGLLSYARNEHALIDTWQPPLGIEIYQLGGYDVTTISGIDLYQAVHADRPATVSYRPLFSVDGDGTVPILSSLLMNASTHVHQLWLDLSNMKQGALAYSHGNMFEAKDVQTAITALLQGSAVFPATVHAMDVPSIPTKKQLAFYVHSPVSLTVIDSDGNESTVSDSASKEGIPGSTAGMFGEVKYVLVPAEAAYTMRLSGESAGTFTLDMQELDDGVQTASSTIADVPVTSMTEATLTLNGSVDSASSLTVDENGDGSTDFSITPIPGTTVFSPTQKTSDSGGVTKHISTRPRAFFASTTSILPNVPITSHPVQSIQRSHPSQAHSVATTSPRKSVSISQPHSTQLPATVHLTFFERFVASIRAIAHALLHFFRMPVGR